MYINWEKNARNIHEIPTLVFKINKLEMSFKPDKHELYKYYYSLLVN